MKFRIITDLHFGKEGYCQGSKRRLGPLAVPIIREFVEVVNNDPETEFVLQMGDAIEDEKFDIDVKNLKVVVDELAKIHCPVYHIAGNHDLRELDKDTYRSITNLSQLSYKIESEKYTFLILETGLIDDLPKLSSQAVELLDQVLATSTKKTIVISHYPFSEPDLSNNLAWYSGNIHRALVAEREEIRQKFNDSRKIACCINGHLHANYFVAHNSIPYFTIQSATDNFRSDGTPAAAHAEVLMYDDKIAIKVLGNDPVNWIVPFPSTN